MHVLRLRWCRDTVFSCDFLLSLFGFVFCVSCVSILLSLFTRGNKEVSEAEFQEKSNYPQQATPRHKLLCKVDVFLPNSDHPPFGTLGARLGKKIESACR